MLDHEKSLICTCHFCSQELHNIFGLDGLDGMCGHGLAHKLGWGHCSRKRTRDEHQQPKATKQNNTIDCKRNVDSVLRGWLFACCLAVSWLFFCSAVGFKHDETNKSKYTVYYSYIYILNVYIYIYKYEQHACSIFKKHNTMPTLGGPIPPIPCSL